MSGPAARERELIEVRDLRLWAHVGVLEHERQLGQWFNVSLRLGVDLAATAASDDLEAGHDYALAVTALQEQARTIRCRTLEHFSERMLDRLEQIYGPIPLQLELQKCRAPIAGFDGTVGVQRSRRW